MCLVTRRGLEDLLARARCKLGRGPAVKGYQVSESRDAQSRSVGDPSTV